MNKDPLKWINISLTGTVARRHFLVVVCVSPRRLRRRLLSRDPPCPIRLLNRV